MPKGMFLKSEGCASNLSDPGGRYTLERYCAATGSAYKPWAFPISLDLFTRYGLWFQSQLVSDLDERRVLACTKQDGVFQLDIEGGEAVRTRHVIVATGLTAATRMPTELSRLPKAVVSHSSEHVELGAFRSRDVVIIGAGQSALETAALLNESGARVHLVSRRQSVVWNTDGTEKRSLLQRIRRPMTPLGGGLRTWVYVNAPGIFYALPEAVRANQVQTTFGPAGAWWLRRRVENQFPVTLSCRLRDAALSDGRVRLHVEREGDAPSSIFADHVIAATGYEVTRSSFPFVARELMNAVRWNRHGPALSRYFESSVHGLYFVGLASVYHYGPIVRFVFGAHQTAVRLARHVAGRCRSSPGSRSSAGRMEPQAGTYAGNIPDGA